MRFADAGAARTFLASLRSDSLNMQALRQALLEDGGPADVSRLNDHEVLELVADRLVSGRLRIAEIRRPRAGVGGSVAREEEPDEGAAPALARETYWLEIVMVDEEDQPVPNERYRVKFPDGNLREGRLDANGVARFPNLAMEGRCEVCFPDRDQEAWVLI